MNVSVEDVALPGDSCPDVVTSAQNSKITLGPGLRREQAADKKDSIIVTQAGVVRKRAPGTFWVESRSRRYVPARGDTVVGSVTQKSGDVFRVDVGGSCAAALSYLAFEGATKKNRPDISAGDVVYARVSVASKDMEPELVCVDAHGKKGRLGHLSGGYVFNCSLNLCRKVLNPSCPLIDSLKNEWPFELAIGHNGRIWIKAATTKETIALGNAILASEYATPEEIRHMCSNISNLLARGG